MTKDEVEARIKWLEEYQAELRAVGNDLSKYGKESLKKLKNKLSEMDK